MIHEGPDTIVAWASSPEAVIYTLSTDSKQLDHWHLDKVLQQRSGGTFNNASVHNPSAKEFSQDHMCGKMQLSMCREHERNFDSLVIVTPRSTSERIVG